MSHDSDSVSPEPNGDDRPKFGEPYCMQVGGKGFYCTRPEGHKGRHIARNGRNIDNLDEW